MEFKQRWMTEPADYSDLGNAAVFVQAFDEGNRWCDALGWLYFDGKRWTEDEHAVMEAADELTKGMLEEAQAAYDQAFMHKARLECDRAKGVPVDKEAMAAAREETAHAKAYLDHAKRSRSYTAAKSMVTMAKHSMVIDLDALDRDPFILNTPGGLVNLETGILKPHDGASNLEYCTHMTKVSPADMQTAADAEGYKLWWDFLETVTCGDWALQGFLQQVAGMALVGRVFHEGIVIAVGSGRNGKSTFFNALQEVLGDYAGSIDPNVLTKDKQNKGPALATLMGKRLALAAELEEGQRLSAGILKQLASTDRLTIERKYHDPATIRQSHTLVLFTNHLPRVSSRDEGTWRRLLVVPFRAVIDPARQVPNYTQTLVERAGPFILRWAIDGAVNFIRAGFRLTVPDIVEEYTEDYRNREDWLEAFLSDRCVRADGARVGASELYQAYKDWAEENGEHPRSMRTFSTALTEAGFQKLTPKGRRVWLGLRINQEHNSYIA